MKKPISLDEKARRPKLVIRREHILQLSPDDLTVIAAGVDSPQYDRTTQYPPHETK